MKTPIYTGIFQSDLEAAGYKITGLPTPAADSEAANKAYVDAHSGGGGGGGTDRKFDVKTYGAIGDGTTDDGVAIRAALAAIPAGGGVLYFPAGIYKYTGATLTLDRKITVEGDGAGVQGLDVGPPLAHLYAQPSITTLDFNSSTLPFFTLTAHGCVFKNLQLRNTSVTQPTAGAGILVSAGGDRNLYENITVSGFYICIDVQAGSGQTFNGCHLGDQVVYALKLRNILVPDGGDHYISNCLFTNGKWLTSASGIRIESGGGIKIINCKIVFTSLPALVNGIDLAVADNVTTVDLLVCNCSIEGYSGTGIKGRTGTNSHWYEILITGNQFNPTGGQSVIDFVGTTAGDFDAITITGNCCYLATSSQAMINLVNCTNVAVTGNAHSGFASLLAMGAGVTFANAPIYIGRDARLVAISSGVKLECRNTGTDTWVEATRYTNP